MKSKRGWVIVHQETNTPTYMYTQMIDIHTKGGAHILTDEETKKGRSKHSSNIIKHRLTFVQFNIRSSTTV